MKEFKEIFGDLLEMNIKQIISTFTLSSERKNFTLLGKFTVYPMLVLLFNFFFMSLFVMFGFVALFEFIFKIPAEMLEPLVRRIEKFFVKNELFKESLSHKE